MVSKSGFSNKLWCLFLVLCLTKVCRGQLMCYVCDNCPKITAETPQFECNEDFFNASGATDSSVQTTTELPKTTSGVTEETTIATTKGTTLISSTVPSEETTTEAIITETTTKETTENVTDPTTEMATTIKEITENTTTTTVAQPPTPSTVAPPKTTTAVPTPPNNASTVQHIDDAKTLNNQSLANEQHTNKDNVEGVEIEQTTTKAYKPSAEFRVRQVRSVSNVTYHCYKVLATTGNATTTVNRGCSRVETMQTVCDQWQVQHPNEHIKKCYPCSRTKCNGSSALNVSITAVVVAVVAVFMHRK